MWPVLKSTVDSDNTAYIRKSHVSFWESYSTEPKDETFRAFLRSDFDNCIERMIVVIVSINVLVILTMSSIYAFSGRKAKRRCG